MANFKILTPSLLRSATLTASPVAESANFGTSEIKNGSIGRYFRAEDYDSAPYIDIDLGSGNTESISYLLIGRGNLCNQFGDTVFTLTGGNTTSTDSAISSIDCATELNGRFYNHLIDFFSATSAFRYFRLAASSATDDILLSLSKLYIGQEIDLGREPLLPFSISYEEGWTIHKLRRFTLNFEGVSESNNQIFIDQIQKRQGIDLFAIYDGNDEILNGERVCFCHVVKCDSKPTNSNNFDISIEFLEQ